MTEQRDANPAISSDNFQARGMKPQESVHQNQICCSASESTTDSRMFHERVQPKSKCLGRKPRKRRCTADSESENESEFALADSPKRSETVLLQHGKISRRGCEACPTVCSTITRPGTPTTLETRSASGNYCFARTRDQKDPILPTALPHCNEHISLGWVAWTGPLHFDDVI